MIRLLGTFLLIAFTVKINATQQQPDYLYFQNQVLSLATGWGHPSPLETYYSQRRIKSPFKMLHTANYRGHVATWEIEDGKLFLKHVEVKRKKYQPAELKIQSKPILQSKDSRVFADWFNGVINARLVKKSEKQWELVKTIYFYVRSGKIIEQQELTEQDFEILHDKNKDELVDKALIKKNKMLHLNHNYISYYFRLEGDEAINFEGSSGRLATSSGFSAVLAYFDNDHMKWPFNWTNSAKNGAPKGQWLVENDKLYLTDLQLNSGTGFYEVDEESLKLSEIFNVEDSTDKVLAKWLSGVFVVKFGGMVDREALPEYQEFKVSEYVFLRLDKGSITEMYKVEKDFDFKNIPYNTLPEIKKIIEDFKQQKFL